MSIEAKFGNLFKPEIQSSARKLVADDKVSISSASDTTIQAYVRATPALKVTLASEGVTSSSFTAECSCPVAKKSRFCKHIWALLLVVQETHSDFLSEKNDIEKFEKPDDRSPSKQEIYQETAKEKASFHRKEQYQKQKSRLKEIKQQKKGLLNTSAKRGFTPEVEEALQYFSSNGFPMQAGPSKDILAEAKRKLSRVFHPDKGGSHAESTELNQHCETLFHFLGE